MFPIKKENSKGSSCKVIHEEGLPYIMYEEMCKNLILHEEAVSHIWLCNCSILNFLMHIWETFDFLFLSLYSIQGLLLIESTSLLTYWYTIVLYTNNLHDYWLFSVNFCLQEILWDKNLTVQDCKQQMNETKNHSKRMDYSVLPLKIFKNLKS